MSMRTIERNTRPDTTARLAALDGLRGLAALVVLAHHSMLLDPAFPASPQDAADTANPVIWWLSYSPLKLATAGQEAVIVFFVLSGLVVTLPVVRRAGFDWIAYFPRRIVRLGIPVIASVIVAAAFVAAIPQRSTQPSGTWLSSSSTPSLSWTMLVRAWDLVGGDGQINNPLWSLRWEILFSLALPVFVVLALVFRRWWIAGVLAAIALTWLGVRSGSGALSYFPAFFVGAVMAARLDDIRAFTERLDARRIRHVIWPALTISASMLLILPWLIGPVSGSADEVTFALKSLAPIAAGLLVVACLGWRPLGAMFSSSPFQFVGRISFSLYLVHVPILIFSAYLFAGQPLIATVAFGMGLALLVAMGFNWLVEQRSQGWARTVGVWSSASYARAFGREERPSVRADALEPVTDRREAATAALRSPAS